MYETLAEVIAVVSILIKFGHDDIIEDKSLFIAFLNELGLRYNGFKITSANLLRMTEEITTTQKKALIEEFNIGHEPVYRKLCAYGVLN